MPIRHFFPRPRTALVVASLLAGTASVTALARQPATDEATPVYDSSQLPAFTGKVAQYDLTPRGDVDGLILDDGTEVLLSPRLGTELVATVRPGDQVTVHGLKARALALVQAMSVTADATNRTLVDPGPGGFGAPPPPPPGPHGGPHGAPPAPPPPSGRSLQAQGTVKMQLHGPRGELNGVLLSDGTMIHLPPPEATRLGAELAPGGTVAARGPGVSNALGTSIEARAFGTTLADLKPVAPPPVPADGPGAGPGPIGGPGAPPPPA